MKILQWSVVSLIVLSINLHAQWYYQYNNPEGYFHDISFTSSTSGWVAGYWILLRTTNGGNSWDTLNQRPQSNAKIRAISFVNDSVGWCLESISNDNLDKIYKTMNAGDDWILQYTFPQYTIIWDIQFLSSNIGFGIGSDPFFPVIWKTTDGGNLWTSKKVDSSYSPRLTTLFFLDSLNGWAADQGIYKTIDGGNTWGLLTEPYWESVQDIQFVSQYIGWYSDYFGVKKTTNGGATWIEQAFGGDGWHTSSLYFIDSDTGYFCPYNQILKTTNGGTNWMVQLQDISLNLSGVCFVNPNDGWTIGYNPGKILHTNNGGLPVELTSFSGEPKENQINLSWVTSTETNNKGFEIERKSDDNIFSLIGFVEGHGTTTEEHSYSFIDKNISHGKYFYRLKQIDFDGSFTYSNEIEVELNLPLKFELEQNYPNPFNPSTKIKYSIPSAGSPLLGGARGGYVTLKVYDILGNEIVTLVNEYKPAGTYEVEFQSSVGGRQLASGIYYYQLKAGEFVQTKKMILLR